MLFHDAARFEEYELGNGNHNVWFREERLLAGRSPLLLAHCAFRSREQLFSKIVLGTLGLLMRSPDDKVTGCHWHKSFERLMDVDFSLSEDEIYRQFLGAPKDALLEKCRYTPLEPVKLRYLDLIGGQSLLKNVLTSYKVTIEKYWEEKARVSESSPAAGQ